LVRDAKTLSRKIVLATVGSLGDLHPFIALGQALKGHGVNTVIASAAEYRSKVEAAGLGFHSLRPGFEELQHDLGMSRAELVRRVVRRSDFLFRKLVLPYVRAAWIAVLLQPMMFLSSYDPPVLPGLGWLSTTMRKSVRRRPAMHCGCSKRPSIQRSGRCIPCAPT
jgi:hypothetical protein